MIEVRSPMEGKVFKIVRSAGERVDVNEVIVVLDAMKMEIEVVSPSAGTVGEIRVEVGQPVEADAVLATLDEA